MELIEYHMESLTCTLRNFIVTNTMLTSVTNIKLFNYYTTKAPVPLLHP